LGDPDTPLCYIDITTGSNILDLNKLMDNAINFGFASQKKNHNTLTYLMKDSSVKTECKHDSMPTFEEVVVKGHAF
jgi:hypothetical protein